MRQLAAIMFSDMFGYTALMQQNEQLANNNRKRMKEVLETSVSVFNGKMFGKTSSGNIIFYEIFSGWFLLVLFYLFSGQIFEINEISYRDLALIALLASVFTAFPMLESVNLMKYISPFTLILTVNLEPVYGIILAFFIFGESEHMSPVFYIASGVMILAIIVNGLIKAKKQKTLN